MTGRLVVIGTPIGNLDDLSPRARAELASADLVACEDTRRTGRLLELTAVGHKNMVVVNQHTEHDMAGDLVERARSGARIALVSDAGMPAISDPGAAVVGAFAAAGLPIAVVPGPSALDTALAGSGLPTGRFVFEGFLPRKGPERRERISAAAGAEMATVVYESPHRMARTIEDLRSACGGDRAVAIGRELTKLHEDWFRGSLDGAARWLTDTPKGEFVLVLSPAPPSAPIADDDIRSALADPGRAGMSRRDAVADVAAALGVSRRRVYELSLGQD